MLAWVRIDLIWKARIFNQSVATQPDQACFRLEPRASVAKTIDIDFGFRRGLDDHFIGFAQVRYSGRMDVQYRHHGDGCRDLELYVIPKPYKHEVFRDIPGR